MPGFYWYHPHVREDLQQCLGLYGNIVVRSADPAYYNPVNREEMLDAVRHPHGRDGLMPFGGDVADARADGPFRQRDAREWRDRATHSRVETRRGRPVLHQRMRRARDSTTCRFRIRSAHEARRGRRRESSSARRSSRASSSDRRSDTSSKSRFPAPGTSRSSTACKRSTT